MRAVELAYAPEPPYHVGKIRAEHAPVGVYLVYHHVAEVLKQLYPLGVVRQYARVQHVRVGHDYVPGLAYRLARRNRRVAVKRERLYGRVHGLDDLVQLGHLVAGERLGREQIKRPRLAVFQHLAQHRQVVAHGLARGRGRDHHEVLARCRQIQRAALMRVQLPYAAPRQHLPQSPVKALGIVRVLRRAGRQHLPVRHVRGKRRVVPKVCEQLLRIHARSSLL